MVYYFPKWCIFKTVDTIKGHSQVRVISFDISRVTLPCSGGASRSMDLTFIHFWPPSQSCLALCLCLDMGQDTVYQLLGFVVVISKKCIPIATLFCFLWEIISSILFVGVLFFLQSTWISSNVCLVRPLDVRHILYLLCIHWFELLHIMFFGLGLFFPLWRGVWYHNC